jgi:hypothetical protein
MKRFVAFAVVLIATSLAYADAGDKVAQKQAEVEWAKGVATDFLKAMKRKDDRQARQLLTPELRDWYDKGGIELPEGKLGKLDRSREDWNWEFVKDKVAPDKDEVMLEGILSGLFRDEVEALFTVRVVKVKESGRWRIDYFLFGEPLRRRGQLPQVPGLLKLALHELEPLRGGRRLPVLALGAPVAALEGGLGGPAVALRLRGRTGLWGLVGQGGPPL